MGDRRHLELGVVLPTFGPHASTDSVRDVAHAAAELGYDSVWASEHILVGALAQDAWRRLLDPLVMLACASSVVPALAVGTSVLILPLHHPVHLAKQAATLQEASGGRFRLGVGAGWYEEEFGFFGVPFEERGERTDESLWLIRAMWEGRPSFSGRFWSFDGATFDPLPKPPPEIWIGGNGARSRERAREHGQAWHPEEPSPHELATMRRRWDGRIVPRSWVRFDREPKRPNQLAGTSEQIAESAARLREAGADGFVLQFSLDPTKAIERMRRFADEVAPALRSPSFGAA